MLFFALEWLPEHEISRLRLRDQDMLQDDAFEVSEALRHQKHHITPWFRNVQPGSIYHSACLSMNLAQNLLRVGFQSPSAAFHGFTPLMTVNMYSLSHRRCLEGTVDLVTWFLDQGAGLRSYIPTSGLKGIAAEPTRRFSNFKAIHRIADAYGEGQYRSHITAEDHVRVSHMRHIISDASTDPCICYCSLRGCTPATLFTRSLVNRFYGVDQRASQFYAEIMLRGIKLISILLSNDQGLDVAADIIRVSTFHRLGMKHTCCRYMYQGDQSSVTHEILAGKYKTVDIMDPEEATEIQEEDQHLALRLEALVAEFTAEFDEGNISFYEFFFGYWQKRMNEVEAERDEACTDDLEVIREIGVVLDGEP